MLHSFFIRIPNFSLSLGILNFFIGPKVILELFLSTEDVPPPENQTNRFKSLLLFYFIKTQYRMEYTFFYL